jgi:hypothetical protein
MNINNISLSRFQIDPLEQKKKPGKTRETAENLKKDSVKLSPEAREMQNTEKYFKQQEVKDRIKSGFYSGKDVLEKVTLEIIKDIQGKV